MSYGEFLNYREAKPFSLRSWLYPQHHLPKQDMALNFPAPDENYGTCPKCSAPGVSRERKLGGDDTCANGCTYPSTEAIPAPDQPASIDMNERGTLTLDRATKLYTMLQEFLDFEKPANNFDMLMDQIAAMADRAERYANRDEAEGKPAPENRAVQSALTELHRLGKAFAESRG